MPQGNLQGGSAAPTPAESWIHGLLSLAPPTEEDLVLLTASPSQQDKLAQTSYPHPSEGRQKKQELQSHGLQNENHNHRKLTNLITWATALSNSMKLSHAVQGHARWTGHGVAF